MSERITRMSLAQIRKLKGLSDAKRVSSMTDAQIDDIIDSDPDLYRLTNEELAEFKLVRNDKNEKDGK